MSKMRNRPGHCADPTTVNLVTLCEYFASGLHLSKELDRLPQVVLSSKKEPRGSEPVTASRPYGYNEDVDDVSVDKMRNRPVHCADLTTVNLVTLCQYFCSGLYLSKVLDRLP
ncbi:unnamed protein product [Soboliphyme baturini]|uniref:RNA-directed RNA polymerase n=1 Tax=Soboliphyme baturini TaxID=241478 RepID=A0A183J8S1_9BILA|nr:unnamed protein product [Soboliphyme baturini]